MRNKNIKKKKNLGKKSDSPLVSIAKTKDIWGISIGLFGVLIGGFSLLLNCTQVTENKKQTTKINELNRKVEAREVRENTPDVSLEINLHRDFIAWNLHSRNAEAEIGYTKWFKGNKQIRGSSDIYLFQKDRYEDLTYIPDIEFRMISPEEILSPDTTTELLRINRYEDFDKLKSVLVANSSLVRVEVCVCSKIYPKNCYAVISANNGRTKVNRKDCLTQGPVIMDPTNILINNTYLND